MTLLLLLRNKPYHVAVLGTAQGYVDNGKPSDFQVAVVLAQTAVEIRTEQAFDVLEAKISPAPLAEWVKTRRPRTPDLTNEQMRRLYVALTGHRIQDEPIWEDFTEHVKRRNEIVHRGTAVGRVDAEASLRTAQNILALLEQHVFRT